MEDKMGYWETVPAVDQAIRILGYLARVPGGKAKLKDICQAVGIHKSKGYSILNTLQRYGLVHRDPLKFYHLGPGLMYLGRKASEVMDISRISLPFLENLSRETGTLSFVGLISGNYLFVVEKVDGSSLVGITVEKGKRFPLLMGAHGKAILTFSQKDERERMLKEFDVYIHDPKGGIDKERFSREMEEVKRCGYAKDLGEMHPGINALSSPIFDFTGGIVGAVVLLGTFGEELVEDFGKKVLEASQGISKSLGYNQ